MRFTTSVAALSLATIHCVSALDGALLRQLAELADQGLNADGTPILPGSDTSTFTTSSADDEVIVAEYVELPIDNFVKGGNFTKAGTFWNRYWVKEGAYRPGGPVFLYDVGEGDAEPYWRGRLDSESSWFMQMIEEYGGVGIVWEHRYYGNSTPGAIDINTPPEFFTHLTTAQSLADIDRFAKQFSRKSINHTLTPDTTPWIMVGGSYSAARAAFMRDKYPDTIFAAFASSAPVEARIDMSAYWDPIVRGMNKYGFGNCSRDVIEVIKYVDKQLAKPWTAAVLKKKFLGWGAENADNGDFGTALSQVFTTFQSYGMEGSPYSLRKFCDWIETDPGEASPPPTRPSSTAIPTAPGIYSSEESSVKGSASAGGSKGKKLAPAEGWAKSKGVKWTVDRWASYPYWVAMIDEYWDTNCSGRDDLEGDCRLNYINKTPGGIAWSWQYCTEWGYFQSANIGPNQIVSKYSSLQHWQSVCHRQWPTAKPPLFPSWPAVSRLNAQFGGWHIRPSNVYWSGGEFDPWRTLSPMSSESWAPRVVENVEPPGCGVRGGSDELFGYVLRDSQHCYDFRNGVGEGEVSRAIWGKALGKWLGCWKQEKGGKGGGRGTGRGWRA